MATVPTSQVSRSVEVFEYRPGLSHLLIELLNSRSYPWTDVPAIGFIAIASAPIAAGFLRRVEGDFAILDGLISNADCTSEERHDGITAVVANLINKAEGLGIKAILATTSHEDVIKRASELGFVTTNQVLIVKSIRT